MANIGYMQVVRHCNQYCRFCSNPETPFILDLDTARRQIDDFAARGYFGIILTGGEPSLSDNIPAIVEYALEKGLHPRMITNGQRLSRRSLAESYVRAGLRHFHVSIHSCKPEIEDFLTGTENSHERALQALQNLSDLGATVNINTVINRYNADHLDKTVEFFVGRFPFLRHFVWNNLDPSMGRADTNRDTAPRLGDFEVALHRAMRFLHDGGRTFRVERVPLCYMAEFAWASTETRKIVKGEERMVHFLDEKGTVRQTDFRHLKAPVCAQCSFDPICGGLFELGDHYDPGELSPVFLPVEPVIKRILEEPDIVDEPRPAADAPTPAAAVIQEDAPLASQRLLLVLTHACNLRCLYCHEIKDESRMPIEVARRALDVYAAARPAQPLIKLFGGEPTLNRDVLGAVLSEARERFRGDQKEQGVRFELTTNGTLLDGALLDLIEAGGDVELHVSLDGTPANHEENRRLHLPVEGGVYNAATRLAPRLAAAGAIVNLTIAPWTAAGVAGDLDHLCALGFRRFNLLPAYYMAWTDEQLAGLRRSFEEIERRVSTSWKTDPIDLTNLDVQAMYTFFNDGLVIDVDGDVFQTNLFLWRPFDGLRTRLRRGNIADDPASWRPHPAATDVDRWIQETATPSTLGSTAAVDRELTRLCERLLVRRSKLTSKTARRPGRRGLAGPAVPS